MAEALVVRLLGSTSEHEAEWITMDAEGARLGGVASGTLEQATAAAGERRVIVLVPGTEVVLARPELPVRSGPRVLQAVPFALEEQIAGDVEEMHFAVGRRDDRPGVPVAGVTREVMQRWHDRFAAADLRVDAVYADAEVVPITESGVTLLLEHDHVHLRRSTETPVVLDVQPLVEAVRLALTASGPEAREHVTLYLSQADYERDRTMIEGLREITASLQVKLLPDGALPLLASCALKTGAVNLLQGAYAPRRQLSVSLAPWRYAAMLAAGLVVVHLGVKAIEYWRLGRAEARLDAAIAEVFAAAMPGTRQVDARAQMEQRYFALRGGGGSGLLANLDPLGAAITETPQTRLEALAYRNRTLDLRMLAPDVNALERIRTYVTERGLTAEIQSANPRENRVEGRLQVRAPGA